MLATALDADLKADAEMTRSELSFQIFKLATWLKKASVSYSNGLRPCSQDPPGTGCRLSPAWSCSVEP